MVAMMDQGFVKVWRRSSSLSVNLPSRQKQTIQAIHRSEFWNFNMIPEFPERLGVLILVKFFLLLYEITAAISVYSKKKKKCPVFVKTSDKNQSVVFTQRKDK